MKFIKSLFVFLLAGLLSCAAMSATKDVSGVKLDETINLAGSNLKLNGAGTRFKVVFKVYVAGLYLTEKADTPEKVALQSGPKRLSVTMLRDIDSAELGKLLTRGIQDNAGKAAMSKLVPGLLR